MLEYVDFRGAWISRELIEPPLCSESLPPLRTTEVALHLIGRRYTDRVEVVAANTCQSTELVRQLLLGNNEERTKSATILMKWVVDQPDP